MLHIGLTGSIGSGKSTLGRLLRDRGYFVLDSDLEVHNLYKCDTELRSKLSQVFGSDILTDQGVNRPLLASRVFSDSEALLTLESLVFPVLLEYLETRIVEIEKNNPHSLAVFVEGALLFKLPDFSKKLDQVWIVEAPETVRLERLIQRGLSREEAQKRIDVQRNNPLPPNAKYVHIDNSGDLEALTKQIPF
jgi:dephospho-CoA kinase